ncbi:MAG: patatin-like phospholipase family protein [Candidatus Levyibacteriota bacterium]
MAASVALMLGLAAATPAEARPRVCLVLSGGGARGAAHVGVLKVLQELRVPVDCIAGTSMGALVGGAYASGMSIADMETLLRGMSTKLLFHEEPPRQEQTIRRKADDRSLLFNFELGVKDGGIKLQKGLVSGVQLETVLRKLVHAPGERNFDDLPIPYRAVATDLVSGEPVVFDHGNLANVMRASMSVPGAIAPAELDGKILVDGGLTDNLPVDVARAMGADVVIAVNLGTPLMKRDELQSIVGVTGQMINILTEQNVRKSLASLMPNDILIEPALGEFSAADFDDLPKAVPIGEAAARQVQARLEALSLPPEQYAALRARQGLEPPPDDRPIDEIRFAPMARVNPEVLRHEMQTKVGEPARQDVLDHDMLLLQGSGDFEHVNYHLLDDAGRRVLDIDAVEKSWGPDYLRFGLGLGSDLQGDAFFNLAASYKRTWLNSLGAEWRTDAQMGRTTRLATEFYQPLSVDGRWFFAPNAKVERRAFDLFQGSQRIARYDLRTIQGELDLGINLQRYGAIRLGYLGGQVNPRLDTGPQALAPPSGSVAQSALVARGLIDQLDSANFPRSGYLAAANVFASRAALGAQDDYTRWDANLSGAYSVGRHTLNAAVRAGGALGNGTLPAYDLFQWGGFLQQSGYPQGALLGRQLTYGRLVYTYQVLGRKLLFDGLYAGASLEAGRMEQPLVPGSPTGLLKSAAVFVGLDSVLGPLYLGYGRAADGNRSAYLYLGRP